MILKSGLIELFKLSKLFENTKAIAGILFGSMARGDYNRSSDVDVLLVYSKRDELEKDKAIFDEISVIGGREIQIVARTLDELERSDKVFLRNVLREGIILFVREPLGFRAYELLKLKPYRIYTYSMENLDVKDKKKLLSALYGYSTRKKVGEKEYRYVYYGIVDVLKLGKNSILVPESGVKEVEELFKSYGVKFKSLKVWLEE